MIRSSAIEALAPDRLRADVAKGAVARLQSKLVLAPAVSQLAANANPQEADLVINIEGEPFTLQLKGATVTAREVLDALTASMAEVFSTDIRFLRIRETDPELAPIINAVVEQVPGAVRARRQALSERHIEALVDVYLANDPLAAAMPDFERDNAQAQADFLKTWPVRTAEDVAEYAGHGSQNRSATATRWKRAGKIFALRKGGREVYPAFQFKDGEPRKTVASALISLPETMSGWQTAFWFVGPNSWLDDKAPVSRLDDEAALVAAARHEADTWMG